MKPSIVHDAKSEAVRRTGPTADRYQAAMVHYLGAVSGYDGSHSAPRADLFHDLRWKLPRLEVSDVMTRAVITVAPDTSFRGVADILARNGITAVPVLDANDHVVGVISHSDLLAKIAAGGETHPRSLGSRAERHDTVRKSRAETAEQLMSSPAVTVTVNTSVVEAARLSARARVHHLPVIDHRNVLVGIVSRSDLLRGFLRDDTDVRTHVIAQLVQHFAIDASTVQVEVEDGVVTLTGQVERRLLITPILDAIRTTTGVVSVHSHLTYAFDDTIFPAPKPIV